VFKSETDTEVLAHLVGELYEGNLEEAVAAALRDVDGAYGLAFVSADEPGVLVAARKGSPLLVGVGEGEFFVASDASALLEHTRSVVYLDDGEMAVLSRDGYRIRNLETDFIDKPVNQIEWDLATIERGGFDHFMLKEIFEQPESLENTLRGHLLDDEGSARVHGLNMSDEELKHIDRIVITACGTSWHSALIGEYMLEELARIPVEVEYASEFRYRNPVVDERTLVIAISQSGETADTLAAIHEAKLRGARTLGLVNVVGSTIAREVEGGLYLRAGPEVGVASTKAFTSQVAALTLVTLRIARLRNLGIMQGRVIIEALRKIPAQIKEILGRHKEIEALADQFWQSNNALYLGRGVNFPVALEGALKLKEISYIHAEGYPAAEMKHGPIALIDENMPVVFIAPKDTVYGKIVSNIEEVKARGGKVIAIVNEKDAEMTRLTDFCFVIPTTINVLTPLLTIIPLQLFSYYVALRRGCNVDQPRNLAKSVTVE
jgi:glucosamine--fructose-6-phosphate aminotransferase (isomerizing)